MHRGFYRRNAYEIVHHLYMYKCFEFARREAFQIFYCAHFSDFDAEGRIRAIAPNRKAFAKYIFYIFGHYVECLLHYLTLYGMSKYHNAIWYFRVRLGA